MQRVCALDRTVSDSDPRHYALEDVIELYKRPPLERFVELDTGLRAGRTVNCLLNDLAFGPFFENTS